MRLMISQLFVFCALLAGVIPPGPQLLGREPGEEKSMDLSIIYINIGRAEEEVFLEELRLAYESGIRVVSFDVPLPWPRAEASPDYTEVDRRLDLVRNTFPGMRVVPRIGMAAPRWWLEQHPDHRTQFDDGSFDHESIASQKWLADAGNALLRFLDYVESNHRSEIMGYHPCCQNTGEWFYRRSWENVLQGLEPVMSDLFKDYCGRRNLDFASVRPIPDQRRGKAGSVFRDMPEERGTVEFLRFQQEVMVDAIERFARIIKQRTADNPKPVFVFYGYTFEIAGVPGGPQVTGHLALRRLLECPDVDVLCSPISYLDRGNAGLGAFMAPVDSAHLHRKTWLFEDDTRTYLSDPADPFGRVETLEQTVWVHRRNFANCLVRNSGIWWMDLYGAGWLKDARIWEHIGELRAARTKLKPIRERYQPDICLIVDEESLFYLSYGNTLTRPLLSELRREILRIGAPVSVYLLSDFVSGGAPPARLYLFLNAFAVDSESTQRVHERLGKNHATAVWFYAPGYLWEGIPNVDGMARLTGIPIALLEEPLPARVEPTDRDIPDPVGCPAVLSPSFTIRDTSGLSILARYSDTDLPAVATIDREDWTSVYSAVPYLSAPFLRYIARKAGVHIYSDGGDVVAANSSFLSIAAGKGGKRRIVLPVPAQVECLLGDGPAVSGMVTSFEVEMKTGETRYWLVRPPTSP